MYSRWNNALAAHFFRPDMAGRPVHLYVTDELLTDLGSRFGSSCEGFLEAVQTGPSGTAHLGLCQKAYQIYKGWRSRKLTYPPYIAYLSLFVLAAGVEGDFAPNAYYPRLRQLIGEEPGSTLPSFDLMRYLWVDLERWSDQDKQGELGVFNVHIAGSWIHVGLPIAQTILTEHERKELPAIFAAARLDPSSPPPDMELVRSLRIYGINHLRPRTLALLARRHDESDIYDVLVETVREELADWDGSVAQTVGVRTAAMQTAGVPTAAVQTAVAHTTAIHTTGEPRQSSWTAHGYLRLCIDLNRVAGTLQTSLRCTIGREFPESGLTLKQRCSQETFQCDEFLPHWSSLLCHVGDGSKVNASLYNWHQGLELYDEQLRWHFRLPDDPIRIFVNGAQEGLPGLMEVRQLPHSLPFYIAARAECCPALQEWAQVGCEGFKELDIRTGLPPRWRFFSVARAISDEPIRGAYPTLSFSSTVRLSLRGGLRSSQGNSFFTFAPPHVVLEGGNGSERVYCNGCELILDIETASYALPSGLPVNTQILLEARCGDTPVRHHSFYLADIFDGKWWEPTTVFNEFGEAEEPLSPDRACVTGAYLTGHVSGYAFTFHPPLFGSQPIYFVGRSPGEIVLWPDEAIPDDWSPVWAILMHRKKGRAVFCGIDSDNASPCATPRSNQRKVKLWKEVLWYWQKRISPPQQPGLRALWKQFKKAASHVR